MIVTPHRRKRIHKAQIPDSYSNEHCYTSSNNCICTMNPYSYFRVSISLSVKIMQWDSAWAMREKRFPFHGRYCSLHRVGARICIFHQSYNNRGIFAFIRCGILVGTSLQAAFICECNATGNSSTDSQFIP